MLKQRLITAAVLIPLMVSGIFFTSTLVLAWVLAAVVLLGAWEWTRLMGLDQYWQRTGYLLLMAMVLASIAGLQEQHLLLLLVIVVLLWCLAIIWIIALNKAGPLPRRQLPLWLSALIGIWLLAPTWLSLILLHGSGPSGPAWVLLMMVLIWGADSGAYFSGRRWGRHKLAVQLSPGKTWEGVSGGAVLALLIVLPLTAWLAMTQQSSPSPAATMSGLSLQQAFPWLAYTLLCLITIAVSVCGDLFESVAKRHAGVKDSGQILPGHGGVLDRIDSLTAAAPCYALGLMLLGLIPGLQS